MVRADCRKCLHFVPLEQMDDELLEKVNEWLEKHGVSEEVRILGWCNYFNRPVTHYVGSCYGFAKKEDPRQRTLLDYVGR